ncbi:MAG: hypothetical protein GQ554_08875 [Deltaproteobacteria bacterium]|nr:hypothetical protein [Deltaproteobacteria bacterium]
MKALKLSFIFVITNIFFNTALCLPQTPPPEMIYDLKNSDIKVMEVSNEVSIMYGGIGKPERTLMDKYSGGYNLKLVFTALPSNKYLSNVVVNILNKKEQIIIKVISEGPIFFASLIPGIYTVKAVYQGKEKLFEHVDVRKEDQRKINISWKVKKAND